MTELMQPDIQDYLVELKGGTLGDTAQKDLAKIIEDQMVFVAIDTVENTSYRDVKPVKTTTFNVIIQGVSGRIQRVLHATSMVTEEWKP